MAPWKCAHPQFWPQKHAKLFMASRGLLRSKGFFFCDDVENPSHGTREISEWQPLYLCRLAKAPPKVWTWRSTMPNFEHGLSTASRPRPPGISCLGAKRVKSRSGRSAPSARRNRRNPKPPPRRSLGPGGEGSKKHSGRNPFYSFYKTEKKIKSNQRKCKSISKHYGI